MPYTALADAVLALHFGVVVFVVGGLLVIPFGHALGWLWVCSWRFRLLHVLAIAFISGQAWLGQLCPLTHLEFWLRRQAGVASHEGQSFIQHWLERWLYVDAPLWALALAYTVFGLLVAAAWWRYPPRYPPRYPTRYPPRA